MKNVIITCILIGQAFLTVAQHWTPEQLLKLKNISSVQVSPKGDKVLYTVREALMTDDRSEYINQIWVVNNDGKNTMQLTHTDKNSSNPKWSPDGMSYAFTSSRSGKTNLYKISILGGEAEQLTDVKSGVGLFDWSPDGKSIAFLMMDNSTEKEEKNKKSKDDWYFMDEIIKQNKLYVLNLTERDSLLKYKSELLIKESYTISDFDWSPDNKSIAYSHSKSPEVNDVISSDISMVEIASGKIKPLAYSQAGENSPKFSHDGKYIAFHSTTDPIDWAGPDFTKLYSLADGKISTLKQTPNADLNLLGWAADSKSILVSEANKTLNSIYKLAIEGGIVSEFTVGIKDYISLASINAMGGHIGFLLQNPSKFPEAYISSTQVFAPVRVTNLNEANVKLPLPKTEVITWRSKDGKEIEGLLTYPVGYTAGQKVPFILNVHGGPAGVFSQTCVAGNGGVYPIAALAEQGFAILRPNPRGSTGYGAEFRMANRADWGGKDYEDIMAGVDQVVKMGVADENRMGVMGWSYGGFMSSWIVGHTNRFKVASIGAPVVDLAHQNLTDDIEGFLPSYFKSDPWNDWAMYDSHSPLRFVQNVKTPVLLQHGEADLRVPFTNSVMFYNALRRKGVPVKLLALPRQPHGPTEPRMVMKTMQSNLEWMNQYLMTRGKS